MQQIRLKLKAMVDLAMAGSNHCRDKGKNYRNKEISKWPEDCRNNRFSVTTTNFCRDNGNFVTKNIEVICLKILLNFVATIIQRPFAEHN